MKLGTHVSIAGGVDKSIERGLELGCEAIQIFVKNNNQWFNPPLKEEVIESFLKQQKETSLIVFAHTGYLINLGTPNPENHEKSMKSLLEEFEKSEELKLPYIVLHPGSHGGEGEEAGIKRIAESINDIFKQTKGYKIKLALETTAGQGASIGHKFEHFAQIFELVTDSDRLGVCADTCHLFAAGYDIKTAEGYEKTWQEFDKLIGIENLFAFHLNDCKKELGSRVDRHEHIGQGTIGIDGFKLLMNDKRFHNIPGILETPKDPEGLLDRENLDLLRSLIT